MKKESEALSKKKATLNRNKSTPCQGSTSKQKAGPGQSQGA